MDNEIDLNELLGIEGEYIGTPYPNYNGSYAICLDGDFTIQELEKIIKYLKELK